MALEKVSNRVYYLPQENETDRPNLYYILGDAYSLAIDAGNSKAHVDKFYQAIREMGFRLPDYTAITHWHWDHTFGMHAVNGVTITGHKTHEKLQGVMNWAWTDEAMQKRLQNGEEIAMCDRDIRVEYPDRSKIMVTTAKVVFHGKLILDLGNIRCELQEIPAPHSRDSVILYIPEEKMLAVGDADCGDHYENGGKYDPFLLEGMIDLLESIPFETYLLGHDIPQDKTEVLAYLREEMSKLATA